MLKPFEILGKKFDKGFRGYEQQEVDKFLAEVVKDYEILYEENMQIKEQLETIKEKLEQYQQLEKTMQNTLMIAQSTAEEIKANAQKEKEFIISEANTKAQQTILELEVKAQDKKQQLQVEIDKKKQELDNIKKLSKVSIAKIRTLLETELKILNEDELNEQLKHIHDSKYDMQQVEEAAEQEENTDQ